MIDIALSIAKKAHAGQVDKAGVDYIQHPLYVASQVKTEQEKTVALLHDVIEDSDVTVDDLLASGLSNEVVTAVQILTKKEGQSYQEYLEKVKSNNLARVVKLADLKHNSDLSRLKSVTNTAYERVKKYKNAIRYLSTQNSLGAFFVVQKGDKMFIWNLVSITAGVIVLLVLLVVGYSIISGMIDGIKKSMKAGDPES